VPIPSELSGSQPRFRYGARILTEIGAPVIASTPRMVGIRLALSAMSICLGSISTRIPETCSSAPSATQRVARFRKPIPVRLPDVVFVPYRNADLSQEVRRSVVFMKR